MWELDCEESWVPKNWCFWIVVLEKTLESPLDCKEIQSVYPKGDQSWVFLGQNDVKVETPILWPPYVKSQLTGKDPDPGKDWGQKEKGATEDEMVGWHYWLKGHEFEQTPGDGEDQGSLACCSQWDHKELDTTPWLNNNHHVPGIMISVKIVLKDSWNIVLRTDEKLKQVSSLGEVTDPSVVRENLLVYFSETCIYAFSELNCVSPNDSQVLTSSACECDHSWKQSLCWCH